MLDDGGGIAADIVHSIEEGAKEVGSIAADELKQAAKAAFTQVTGKQLGSSPSAAKSSYSQLTGKSVSPMGNAQSGSWFDELKKFGQSASSQFSSAQSNVNDESLAKMAKNDSESSKKEADAVAAKVNQIYAQYAAKRAKELEQKKLAQQQQEQKVKEAQTLETKKQAEQQLPSIAKTRAENKNYGAE